jgi:hypothetical protein
MAASASVGSCASSASAWMPRPSGRCCDDTAWAQRRDAPARPGRSSCEPKPRASWRATCTRWRRSGSRSSTGCASSTSVAGGSFSPGSRPSLTLRGSLSRPGMPRWISAIGECRSGFCSATTMPSSLVPSTTCSVARVGRSSDRRSGRRRRMPTPSAGSRLNGRTVWTGRCCSGGAICCGCCVAMFATTTSSGRTAAWRWPFPRLGGGSHCTSILRR